MSVRQFSQSPKDDISRVLIGTEEIRKRVSELGAVISKEYCGKDLTIVPILKGSVVFLSDLLREISIPCSVNFISISSYKGHPETSGVARMIMDLRESPVNKNILMVEDIIDTGYTLDYLLRNFRTRSPASIKICVLLDKTDCRKVHVPTDFVGFNVPDEFLVGYGS